MPSERRQRGSHQDGRGREGKDRQAKANECEFGWGSLKCRKGESIRFSNASEHRWRQDGDDRECYLERAVQPEPTLDAIGDATAHHASDGHATKEAGQYGGHSLCRIAEDEDEFSRPDDLVDESGGS